MTDPPAVDTPGPHCEALGDDASVFKPTKRSCSIASTRTSSRRSEVWARRGWPISEAQRGAQLTLHGKVSCGPLAAKVEGDG